jgi:hypothetical protein
MEFIYKSIPRMKKLILLLFSLFIIFFSLHSQKKSETSSRLFNSEGIIDLRLELYFDSLLAGGVSESVKYSATLHLLERKNNWKTFHIELSKRGHFRKFPNICDFPPLRIHFKEEETVGSEFEGIKKIKMVTHCQNEDTAFEQYVIQEYLIYKTYNILTNFSFRTRLARIHYIDLSKTYPDVYSYTFLIENPGSLAERMNAKVLDVKYINPENFEPYTYALMTLFQYMVINQDWSVSLSHNIEIIALLPNFQMVAVPFDFDMCGIIAIPYKSPTVPFKKGEKPERNYLGQGISTKQIIAVVDTFRAHKNEIIKVFNSSPLLTPTNRKNIIMHLTEFYDNISDFDFITQKFIRN